MTDSQEMEDEPEVDEEEEEEESEDDDLGEKSDRDFSSLSSFPNNNAISKLAWPTDVTKINFRSFMSTVSYL